MLSTDQVTGITDGHVIGLEELSVRLHPAAAQAFLNLRVAASEQGIDLVPCSGFRSFDEQQLIWNAKFDGERPLYGDNGETLCHADLDEQELLASILRWSALPGASRHHWGTDLDVIDRAAIPEGYDVRLMCDEYEEGGVFAKLGAWLDETLPRSEFFRPYTNDNGGVQREPWHLSFAPIAVSALDVLTIDALRDAVEHSELKGREKVLEMLPSIFERYVLNVDEP